MQEQKFTDYFIDNLVNKYGYPKQAIKKHVKIGGYCFDVAIQKGVVYVQVFEFHNSLTHEVHNVYQRFSDVSVETPFYCVIFDDKGKFKLYDGNNLEKEVQDIASILNYKNAIARFFRPTLNEFSAVKNEISAGCYISAFLIMLYVGYYLFYHIVRNSGCCGCCPRHVVNNPMPLSYELLAYLGLIIFLLIFPSVLKLWNYIKRIKIGSFELDLRDELYN